VQVAIVARTIPPVDRGGIQYHVQYLAEETSALGADVTLYLHRGDSPQDLPFKIEQVRTIPLPRLTAGLYMSLAAEAGRRLKGTDFDVYHGQAMYGWGIPWNDLHPHVITSHGTQLNEYRATVAETRDPNHRITDSITYRMERYAARRADRVIVDSKLNERDVVEQYGVDPEIITIVHPVIPIDRFKPAKPEGHTIVYMGRLSQRKGIKYLIQAMPEVLERVPEARLRIGGSGEREGVLRKLTAKLGLEDSVEFLGFVPDEDLPDLYASGSVFCMPSVYEGFGMVMLEAMASSMPVVAFRTGGVPEVVEDGVTGYQADAETLGDRLARVLEDPKGAAEMGRKGRRSVEDNFTVENMAKRTMAVWEDAAGR
jgi:glycosyltransferase involved in cell wall biosynthesis